MDQFYSPEKILCKLEELRKWQKLQEQRLLQHQAMERLTLTSEQEKLFESFNTSNSSGRFDNDSSVKIDSSDVSNPNAESKQSKHFQINSKKNLQLKVSPIRNKESLPKVLYDVQQDSDEMPIKSTSDFNVLVEKKLNDEHVKRVETKSSNKSSSRKPFLRKGAGMVRFGMTKDDIGRHDNMMPWTRTKVKRKIDSSKNQIINQDSDNKPLNRSKKKLQFCEEMKISHDNQNLQNVANFNQDNKNCEMNAIEQKTLAVSKNDSFIPQNSLSLETVMKEQQNYFNLLKQYNRYLDFIDNDQSSDTSIMLTPSFVKVSSEKENAEQQMFELIEKKVTDESFSSTNSFFSKLLKNCNSSNSHQNAKIPKIYPSTSQSKSNVNCNWMQAGGSKQHHQSSSSYDDNTDSYDEQATSESSESEETCRMVIGKEIPTSTPNEKDKCTEKDAKANYDKMKNKKFVRIIIKSSDTEKSAHLDINDSQSEVVNENTLTNTEDNNGNEDEKYLIMDLHAKKELLKTRLQELESEIEVFRLESVNLSKLKEELKAEREEFLKEKAKAEEKLNEDKVIAEYYLAEEKEKLQKQKLLYDRHAREMKERSSRKDRETINGLQQEIVQLKEQIVVKDSKSGAAQARLRNQIKNLEKERSELKTECENLKKENRKLKNFNDRAIRLQNIAMLTKINKTFGDNIVIEAKDTNSNTKTSDRLLIKSHEPQNDKRPLPSNRNMRSRTRSAPNISVRSKYAKYFSEKNEHLRNEDKTDSTLNVDSDSDYSIKSDHRSDEKLNKSPPNKHSVSNSKYIDSVSKSNPAIDDIENIYKQVFHKETQKSVSVPDCNPSSSNENDTPYVYDNKEPNTKFNSEINFNVTNKSPVKNPDRIENRRSDGSLEVKYSNGNHKVISADGSHLKFFFYNGDVKEIFYNDGIIKYFYKERKIYHTTYKDGLQILEFPDGYMERRYPDGSVQAHLSDGTTRWIKPDSNEEWHFPNGTIVSVNSEGEQTLRFSNGQVEVHTAEFKKREFPDGTVRTIYADGTIETKYSSGRIRLKDKNGNLVMDTANQRQKPHL